MRQPTDAMAIERFYDLALLRPIAQAIAALRPQGSPYWLRVTPQAAPTPRRLALLAGSFNPPTMAHLALAAAAAATGLADEVTLTISKVTVDKEAVTRATLLDRLLVLRLLLERINDTGSDAALFSASLINRGLYADQALAVRSALPDLDTLYFVVGFDKIVQVMDPRYYDDRDRALDSLFGLASFLVAPRAQHGSADLEDLFGLPQNRRYGERVHSLPLPAQYADHSSTAARAGDAIAHLPEEARAFLAETLPYAQPEGAAPDPYGVRQDVLEHVLRDGATLTPHEVRHLCRPTPARPTR